MSADSPKLQKAKTTPAITAAASALSTSDASTASTSDVANKDAGAKRHNKSKTANNGASHFDLTELSAVLRADTRAQVERTQVAHLAARTAICCDVCGESIIPALWRRPLARGFMLKRGAIVKSWKRRWFILSGRHLLYCLSDKSVSEKPPIGVIHLKSVHVGIDDGHALSNKERKKVVGAKSAFAWFLKTEKRMWHFVCEDATERDRWIANVRAIDRRPFARFCFGCLMHAAVPSPTQYVVAGSQKALAGPHAGSAVYVVVARGHCFVFASSTQHELDRSRVLPGGILHLHGSVVSRLRKGLWQVVTPNDGVVHQFELVAKGGAPALETEFDEWMAALRQEQHVPPGEEAPTSIDGPRVNPEDVDVNELRKVLYRNDAETESYRDLPKNSLADKRVSLARLGVGPRSTAIDVALQAVQPSVSGGGGGGGGGGGEHSMERRVSRAKSVRTGRARTAKDEATNAPLHSSAAVLASAADDEPVVSPRLKRSRSVDRTGARSKNGSPALEARMAFVASVSRSSPNGISEGAATRGRASTTSSPRNNNNSSTGSPQSLMSSPTRQLLSASGGVPRSPRALSPARSVSPRTALPTSPSAHRRVSEKQLSGKPRGKQDDDSSDSDNATRNSLTEIQMTLGGFRLDDSKELVGSAGSVAPIDEEYYYDEVVSQRKSVSKPTALAAAASAAANQPVYDDDDDDEATLVVDEVADFDYDDEIDENEESSGDEMD